MFQPFGVTVMIVLTICITISTSSLRILVAQGPSMNFNFALSTFRGAYKNVTVNRTYIHTKSEFWNVLYTYHQQFPSLQHSMTSLILSRKGLLMVLLTMHAFRRHKPILHR